MVCVRACVCMCVCLPELTCRACSNAMRTNITLCSPYLLPLAPPLPPLPPPLVREQNEFKAMFPSNNRSQQKLRVCEICGCYLSIFDNDRRCVHASLIYPARYHPLPQPLTFMHTCPCLRLVCVSACLRVNWQVGRPLWWEAAPRIPQGARFPQEAARGKHRTATSQRLT